MIHESNKKEVAVADGKYKFEDIYHQPFVKSQILKKIRQADILILPYENFRGRTEYLFPEDTYAFFDYLSEQLKETGLVIEICSTDEEYKELELHADVINIADIILNYTILPLVINLVSNYLYDKLKKYNRKNINTNINLTVEKNGRSKKIHYEGSIENFVEVMKSISKNMWK